MRGRFIHRYFPWYVAVPFILFVLHSLLFTTWLVDDAAISFAYARNLAHGHGLVAQIGAKPVEGFSNPLWTFLLATVFARDPTDPVIPIKIISLAMSFATFLVIRRVFRILLGPSFWERYACAAALTALALNTSVVTWTISGLENPLYALLTTLYCLYCMLYMAQANPSARTITFAGLTAAGLALTRPDGILFAAAFPVLAIVRLSRRPRNWQTEARSAVAFLPISLAPCLAYLAFRRIYFGDWLPNTYYAKDGPGISGLARIAHLPGEYLSKTSDLLAGMFADWAWPIVAVMLIAMIVVLYASPRRSRSLAVCVVTLCAWAIYCILPVDWMAEYRFATPFFVLFYILLFSTLAAVAASIRVCGPNTSLAAFITVTSLVLLQSAAVYAPRSNQFAAAPTAPFRQVVRNVALRFNAYADALHMTDASVLCPDVGGPLYYSRLKVYDLGGLCDRRISRLIDRDPEGIRDYVLEEIRPTFIDVHDSYVLRTQFQRDPRFRSDYVPIWEAPCGLARHKRQPPGLFDGHYIRKDAIRSWSQFLRLLMLTADRTFPANVQSTCPIVPFPRDHRPAATPILLSGPVANPTP